MKNYRVVVQGGGNNLYKISDGGSYMHVYKVTVGLLSDSNHSLGKTKTLDAALSIIRSHSGKEIKSID